MSYMKQENPEFDMDSNNISSSSNLGDGNPGEYGHQPNQSSQSSITAFLAKLWALVNDPTCDDLIAWDPTGGSFHVYDQARFSREILPRYFKHNNFASFIRQLNMYGFRKISNIEHGSLKNEGDDIEFAHPHFIRGQESLLESIKRRAPESQRSTLQGGSNPSSALVSANYIDPMTGRSREFTQLLDDVRNLHTKQSSLNDKLSYMQTENQALWGEIGSLRQKHSKQQQTVSKIMKFLLHFISVNSAQSHEHSVEQPPPNEGSIKESNYPQQTQAQHHTNNTSLSLAEQGSSPNTLKRKHAALMHNDEPDKRLHMQQQQQQQQPHQQYSQPPNFGRQQSVTINELSDKDASGWHHATNASPLIDLVPSPPPSIHSADDNYQQHHQQQPNDYGWPNVTTGIVNPSGYEQKNLPQANKPVQTFGNGNGTANNFVPDFFLRTNNTTGGNTNIGQADTTGTQTSGVSPTKQVLLPTSLKQELFDFPNTFQATATQPADELKLSPTLNAQNQPQQKLDPPSAQVSFSLDDITGDVDHIQSSLDSIREFMFENLPEGTSIEDLFGEDAALLSPLLHSTSTNDQTPNLLLENIKEQQQPSLGNHQSDDPGTLTNSQSVPDINNQLLEQLINETAIIEEQQSTINQLAHEKSNLEDKIHILEQQQTKRK